MEEKSKHPGVKTISEAGMVVGYHVRATWRNPVSGRWEEADQKISGGTLQEAVLLRAKLLANLKNGSRKATPQTTLGAYAKLWLERRSVRLKMSTLMGAAKDLEKNILPYLGNARLDQIRKGDIEDWMLLLKARPHHKTGKPLSNTTVNHAWRILKTIIRDAVSDLRLAHDPTERVKAMPAVPRPDDDPNSLTPQQVSKFLAFIRDNCPNPQHYPYVFLGMTTGMRCSELSALKWSDIDEDGVVRLSRGQVRGFVSTPKTCKIRKIPVEPEVLEALREYRLRMIREQPPGLASGLIFPSASGGYHYSSWTDKILKWAVAECEIGHRLTMQGLRRTYTDLMRRAGVKDIVAQATTGHSSNEMTEHYSTVGMDERQEAAKRLMTLVKTPDKGPSKGPDKGPEGAPEKGKFGVSFGVRGSGLTTEGS